MSRTKELGKAAATGGLFIAACAACCAPLIAPLIAPWVVGAIAASGAGLALVGQVGLALALLAGAGLYLWSRRRRQIALLAAHPSKGSCGCAPDAGCNVGDACELPQAAKPGVIARLKALC